MLNRRVNENYILCAFYYEIFFILQLETLIHVLFAIFYYSIITISHLLSQKLRGFESASELEKPIRLFLVNWAISLSCFEINISGSTARFTDWWASTCGIQLRNIWAVCHLQGTWQLWYRDHSGLIWESKQNSETSWELV
jgi:hypothetical protein